MKKENKTIMEIKNIPYVERPHAILKCKLAGFSIEEIKVNRISVCRYDVIAIKNN